MKHPFYHSSTPIVPDSLHSLSREHDNCGMGAIAHLQGERSFTVLDHALTSVSCMIHRGAVDADMKTGDGSGILPQSPFLTLKSLTFFATFVRMQGLQFVRVLLMGTKRMSFF